jgi:hypothetical protein
MNKVQNELYEIWDKLYDKTIESENIEHVINTFEPAINTIEPVINTIEPAINTIEPVNIKGTVAKKDIYLVPIGKPTTSRINFFFTNTIF